MSEDRLTEREVGAYLRGRGVVGDGHVRVTALGGGVSNVVLAVDCGPQRLVVKQSLERLLVADEWRAPRRRILAEARGMIVAAQLTPDRTPEVVDVDPDRLTLTMRRAPSDWRDWKSLLLEGELDAVVARGLGDLLGTWHRRTAGVRLPPELANDPAAFEALRLDPYHEAVARRLPERAAAVRAVAERIRGTRVCLVHGDFSPKNILVGPDGRTWVIDFEVAHLGDPQFDVAFLLSHLVLKAVVRPRDRAGYEHLAAEFLDGYRTSAAGLDHDEARLVQQVACLLLARAVGKSPAEYLEPAVRGRVVELAAPFVDAERSVHDVFSTLSKGS